MTSTGWGCTPDVLSKDAAFCRSKYYSSMLLPVLFSPSNNTFSMRQRGPFLAWSGPLSPGKETYSLQS